MEWLDRMNSAMDYIESNLANTISYDRIARLACCSRHHFQHMFPFITGVSLSEYIRRRRLTLAAFELQTTGAKVIDTAIKYGYESPEAFARAFKDMHGVPPVSARNRGVSLKAYPRMTFQISVKGEIMMEYRMEERDAFEVFGLELQTNVIDGQCFRDIPAFWQSCAGDGRLLALAKAAGKKPTELLDAGATYDHDPNGNMKYLIGCILRPGVDSGGYTVLRIPRQTWAVFSVEWTAGGDGDAKLHETWRRIYSEWFPTAQYEHADCDFDLELYYGERESEYGVAVWIPVVKKDS